MVTSSLVFQWLFARLSPRFGIAFLAALGAWLVLVFPATSRALRHPLVSWEPGGAPGRVWEALSASEILGAAVVLGLVAMGLLVALWTATAAYRVLPPRPAAWHRPRVSRLAATAPRAAEPLGLYRRIGIILAGGGAKGAYQAGALDALHRFLAERGALGNVKMIAASSIGAWNACFWLTDGLGTDGGPCETWWHRVSLREVLAPTFYLPRGRNYVVSAEPWRRAFRTLFRDDPAASARLLQHLRSPMADGNVRFYMTRTNVERAHLEFSTNREDLLALDNASGRKRPLVPPDRWTRAASIDDVERAVFASMDLPPLFEYARFGDELFEDGGVVDNLPIYFGTGIERCDLLFVFPLNASFVAPASLRSLLYRVQRVLTIRQGALERKALKDVYLYNELAALRHELEDERARHEFLEGAAVSVEPPEDAKPARSAEALADAARQTIEDRAAQRIHRQVQIFAVCPDEPLAIDTIEFWKTREAGRAYRLMREYTAYELAKFDFDAEPNWIRVALVNAQGETHYLEDF